MQEFDPYIVSRLDQKKRIYLTGSGLYAYDPEQIFSRHLQQQFQLELVGEEWMEDWHRSLLKLRIGREKLYRISLKDRRDYLKQ